MIVAGLTGSIAMGKTETARLFALRGVPVFDSDAAVHQLYAKGGKAVSAIAEIAPEAVTHGGVNRERLSELIREHPENLLLVERAVHPLVRAMQDEFLAKARNTGCTVAILDIPLLFETNRDKDVDKIVVVSTSPEIQRRRALQREGMTVEKLDFILSRQLPDVEKRRRADYVIDTSISIADSQRQVDCILTKLVTPGNS